MLVQDAMSYKLPWWYSYMSRIWTGPPDLFITFTCNPKWPEITRVIQKGEQPNDRADIIVRVFNM